MSIAVDQPKLRHIVDTILTGEQLDQNEATMVLQIARLAAGADEEEKPAEHAVLQAIAQRICSLVGLEAREISAIPPLSDNDARRGWFRALASELHSRPARELAFAMAFLASVADLDLRRTEQETLEELQSALGVDDRRATDIVVLLTDIIASSNRAA